MSGLEGRIPRYPKEVVSVEALTEVGLDITKDDHGISHIVDGDDWTEDPQ